MELGPNQRRWVEALRSGQYKQGRSFLCKGDEFCCLGVACDLLGVPYTMTGNLRNYRDEEDDFGSLRLLPDSAKKAYGLRTNGGSPNDPELLDLFHYNDSIGKTFEQIADIIEKHAELYFEEAK